MKPLFFLMLLSIILYSNTFGQQYSHEFGEVNTIDFQYVYEDDKNAEAIVLYDIGETKFKRTDNGFVLHFEKRTKIKIQSKSALEKFLEVEVPYYKETHKIEKVENIEASTYNIENGQITETKLLKDAIFEDVINENWYVKKFTIPDVREGSVIEYRYTVESPFFVNLKDWEFQWTVPTAYSEYTVKMIPFYEYVFILQGTNKFDEQKSYTSQGMKRQFGSIEFNDNVHHFVMKNVPAFKDAEYITSVNDYIIKLDFQLARIYPLTGGKIDYITTWPDLIKELDKHQYFGDFIKKSEKQFSKSDSFVDIENKPDMEKFEYGVNYVKANYSWDGRNGKYANKDFKEFEREKTGNAGCINLYLTGVLQSMGLEAYPLILSTRNHGKIIESYPFSSFFNYTVVAVKTNNSYLLTDATDILNSQFRIPIKCMNGNGLIIKEDEEFWLNLNPNFISRTEKFFKISLNENLDSIRVNEEIKAHEYEALYFRNRYYNDTEKLDEYITSKEIFGTNNLTVENANDASKPYILKFCGTQSAEVYQNKVYISPFLNQVVAENPFKQETRNYPIDMIYPNSHSFSSIISIPEGYAISAIPNSFNFSNELADINYAAFITSDNEVKISGWYTFKHALYHQDYYSKLKYFYMEIIKHFNQQVVLEKET